MSSHSEAPEISKDPVADSTDLYAFVSPDRPGYVTLIANYIPREQPAGGPNFFEFGDDVLYEIHVDNDGDADSDVTFQFRFTTELTDTGNNDTFLYNTGQITSLSDSTWNRKQFYSVTRVDRRAGSRVLAERLACPPCNIGVNSIPDYSPLTAQAVHSVGSMLVFAGQRADGFYVDLGSIFDLGLLRPFHPDFLLKGAAVAGINTLASTNVHSIAIQLPISELTKDGSVPTNYTATNSTIGVWTTASRQKTRIYGHDTTWAGPWHQVSRLGNPLINEVVIPMGMKDYWNRSQPKDDAQFAKYYDHPGLAALLNVLYPGAFPNLAAYSASASNARPDLDAILLTGVPPLFANFQNYTGPTKSDMLRLNVVIRATPTAEASILGVVGGDVAGYPNGRRVYDDVTSIALKAVAGALLGDVVATYTPDAAAGALYDVGGPSAEPTSVASLSAFGLSYGASFPYLGDPWNGNTNPASQPIGVAG
jgi:hypothetical protein